MAFTFAELNQDNEAQTYNLSVSVNPDTAIFNQTFEVGDVAAGLISVANTGDTNTTVYLTADWGPLTGTSDVDATVLANALVVSVFTEGNPVFGGRLIDLINQEVITGLEPTDAEGVAISVTMPDDRTGPTLMGKGIHTDFVFVAVSVS